MELILLGAGAWAFYAMWQQVEQLKRRVDELEGDTWLAERVERLERAAAKAEVAPASAPSPDRQSSASARPVPATAAAPDRHSISVPLTAKVPTAMADTAPQPIDDVTLASALSAPTEPASSSDEPTPWRPAVNFEDLFGRLLPIWAGGITLAVAGLFIVRYSIDAGLLTPPVRLVLAMLFGVGLIGGAEAAFRFEARVADPRVRQALAGAGLATLYAGFYLAGTTYGLIGPFAAFVGLAAVTAAALGLSYRFGMPCAVLALIGGFAAPLLVGGDAGNVPLLTGYLALVTTGLTITSRNRRWAWLGLAALGGGLGWGLLLLAGFAGGVGSTLAIGLFLVLLGVVVPAWAMPNVGNLRPVMEAGAAGVAALQMALLIDRAADSLLAWGLFALLAAALAVLGWYNPRLRRASGFAAVLVPLLLAAWDSPPVGNFALTAAALAVILAGVPAALAAVRRHGWTDLIQLCFFALALPGVAALQFGTFDDAVHWGIGGVALAMAAFPAFAAWRLWPEVDQKTGRGALLLVATTALLVLAGGLWMTPGWAAPIVAAGVGGGLLLLGAGRRDAGLANLAWAAGVAVAGLLSLTQDFLGELPRLAGAGTGGPDGLGALRWAMAAALGALLAWREHRRAGSQVGEIAAALFAYGTAAQIVPADALAWLSAVAAGLLLLALRGRMVAATTFAALAGAWALPPAATWGLAGMLALFGQPVLLSSLPTLHAVALHLLPFAAALIALVGLRRDGPGPIASYGAQLAAAVLLVPAHIGFKHLLAIDSQPAFVSGGLAERTLWEMLLAALAAGAWQLRARYAPLSRLAWGMAALAAGHWCWFTLTLHNPLWAAQHVGPVPLLNLLLPAYGVPVAALVVLRRRLPDGNERVRPVLDGATQALIALFSLSALRQVFSGTDLTAVPLGQTEDLLRSLTGIVLAILFLLIGARRDERNWRIGSLAVMLAAVLKVFLVDAAGLEGLARIASFVCLGFSLIGIGWFYARQLKAVPVASAR